LLSSAVIDDRSTFPVATVTVGESLLSSPACAGAGAAGAGDDGDGAGVGAGAASAGAGACVGDGDCTCGGMEDTVGDLAAAGGVTRTCEEEDRVCGDLAAGGVTRTCAEEERVCEVRVGDPGALSLSKVWTGEDDDTDRVRGGL